MSLIKLLLAIGSAAALTACGGGGSASPAATNKWVANNGTYVGCDGNTKSTVVFAALGTDQATLSYREDIYASDLCTGVIQGTLTYSSPATMTYQSTTSAAVTGVGVTSQNLTIDKIQTTVPALTGTLTGPGVQGLCVNYTNGNTCYNNLNKPATTTNSAIYLTPTTFATLTVSTTGYSADQPILTKQ